MKADEYQVLVMAVEEGVRYGMNAIRKMDDDDSYLYEDTKAETKMVDSVLDSILSWFHIERPWIKESDV
jgi:hypothetical protein